LALVSIHYQTRKTMKYCRVFRYSLFIFSFWVIATAVYAQETKPIINASLVGTIIDAQTKEPIEGATVQLEAVTHRVKTDRNGKFEFVTGQKLPFTILVSFVGYEQQRIVASHSPIVVELKTDYNQLSEIVVVGYSQKKKSNITGAVSEVKGNELTH